MLIPVWLARRNDIPLGPDGPRELAGQVLGAVLLVLGLTLFGATCASSIGGGRHPAPWDPPRRLVVRGPYAYVRNPMISGVVMVLLGEALVLLSRPHLDGR